MRVVARPHCALALDRLSALRRVATIEEQQPTRAGDLADHHADLWTTAQRIDDDTHHCIYMTCLKQRTDGKQVFVTCQDMRERFAGDATEQGVLVALLPNARSGYFQWVIFHRVIVIK
ncbi:hypothetical protein C7T35_39220 [Variovorax sp. WS11]|nr:hypothetical protein C7T35_39220 [Variovorax sp. WS11]